MNNSRRKSNYWVTAIAVFLLIASSNKLHAQEKVKASGAFLKGDYLVIQVTIPTSNAPCFSIQQVELMDLATKTKTVAKSLEGTLKNLPAGNQQFFWNYKKDEGYVSGDFEIIVSLEACPFPEIPPTIIRREKEYVPAKPDSNLISKTKTVPSRMALKLLVGGTGVITAIMANSIKSSFDSKVAILTTLENTLPQINGQFTSQADLDKWNTAYANAKAAQQTGLLNALVAGSVLSLAYEVYLVTSKSDKMNVTRKISLSPSADYRYNTGLSLIYHFN